VLSHFKGKGKVKGMLHQIPAGKGIKNRRESLTPQQRANLELLLLKIKIKVLARKVS